ncbi:hypothetical protein MHYP_G00085190 [Metynnis hypsauchen]
MFTVAVAGLGTPGGVRGRTDIALWLVLIPEGQTRAVSVEECGELLLSVSEALFSLVTLITERALCECVLQQDDEEDGGLEPEGDVSPPVARLAARCWLEERRSVGRSVKPLLSVRGGGGGGGGGGDARALRRSR